MKHKPCKPKPDAGQTYDGVVAYSVNQAAASDEQVTLYNADRNRVQTCSQGFFVANFTF